MAAQRSKASRGLRIARVLATVVALPMFALGVRSIWTEHYYGYTSKYGGSELVLAGVDAQVMGLLYIALGALPLALWLRTPKAGAWWATVCATMFVGLLGFGLYG